MSVRSGPGVFATKDNKYGYKAKTKSVIPKQRFGNAGPESMRTRGVANQRQRQARQNSLIIHHLPALCLSHLFFVGGVVQTGTLRWCFSLVLNAAGVPVISLFKKATNH